MNNFQPDNPYTGTGEIVPKAYSYRHPIKVVFRTPDGKKVKRKPKEKK